MARKIEISENILFDVLDLIDDRADELREQGDPEDAELWENDANVIREALGIEIDEQEG